MDFKKIFMYMSTASIGHKIMRFYPEKRYIWQKYVAILEFRVRYEWFSFGVCTKGEEFYNIKY